MARDQLDIAFDATVYRYFAPSIEGYCSILLTRVIPIFDDLDGEQQRATDEFLSAASSWFGDDYDGAMESAYDHAQSHVLQFMEMRTVFLATGVNGLFHLFEKQLYLHINKELKGWLMSPVGSWQDLENLIPKFDHKWGQDTPCPDLVDAFRDADLQELRLVANTVKHGGDGPSYRQLVKNEAIVVSKARLDDDWTAGPFSVLGVSLSVQPDDVERYRSAILRFWKVEGSFRAPRTLFP